MNRSFTKIKHIQESNLRLEKRLLNEKGWFSRNKKDDMDLGGDKYNEMIRRMSDYDKNPTYTDLTMEEPHNYPHLKYTVMKVDDCSKNSFFMTPTLDMVMINYCNYDGESTIEELNRKEDSMWTDMMRDIKRQFNHELNKRDLPHRY